MDANGRIQRICPKSSNRPTTLPLIGCLSRKKEAIPGGKVLGEAEEALGTATEAGRSLLLPFVGEHSSMQQYIFEAIFRARYGIDGSGRSYREGEQDP